MTGQEGAHAPPQMIGLGSIFRHRRLVICCAVLSMALGVLAAALKPVAYTAYTQLLVYTREVHPGPEPVISPGRADIALVQNQVETVKAPSTLNRVVAALNLTADPEFATPGLLSGWWRAAATGDEKRVRRDVATQTLAKRISVARVGTSHTILVQVTASTPEKAARIANELVKGVQAEAASDENEGFRTSLRERWQGLGPSTYLMSAAVPPPRPNGPRRILIAALVAAAGLAFGVGCAVFLDFRDRSVRSAAQIEALGLPCLGPIPTLAVRRRSGAPKSPRASAASSGEFESAVLEAPGSLLSMTLRRTQTDIETAGLRSIGIASVAAGEGATFVASNLAHLVAQSGKRVLLIRETRTHGAPPERAAVGPAASPPAPMILGRSGLHLFEIERRDTTSWSRIVDATLAERANAYDLVAVDLPPLCCRPQFQLAAQKLDGVLLVLKWGKTEWERLCRLLDLPEELRGKFIGALVNGINNSAIGRYDRFWSAEAELCARRGTRQTFYGPASLAPAGTAGV